VGQGLLAKVMLALPENCQWLKLAAVGAEAG
jgi:hypothetical protein